MQPPELEPFLDQQTPQHAAAREGEFHVQFVDAMHQPPIGVRHRARLVVDAAPADPQHHGLTADAQPRGGIGSPALSDHGVHGLTFLRAATGSVERASI